MFFLGGVEHRGDLPPFKCWGYLALLNRFRPRNGGAAFSLIHTGGRFWILSFLEVGRSLLPPEGGSGGRLSRNEPGNYLGRWSIKNSTPASSRCRSMEFGRFLAPRRSNSTAARANLVIGKVYFQGEPFGAGLQSKWLHMMTSSFPQYNLRQCRSQDKSSPSAKIISRRQYQPENLTSPSAPQRDISAPAG